MNRQLKFYIRTGVLVVCAIVTLMITGSWWICIAVCVGVWCLLAVASVIMGSRVPGHLAELYDNYLMNTDLVDAKGLKSDYLEIDGRSHFVSYRPQPDGLFVLHSAKRLGIIPWDQVLLVQEHIARKQVRIVLCPNESYSGPRDLLLPWDCEFMDFVPARLLGSQKQAPVEPFEQK